MFNIHKKTAEKNILMPTKQWEKNALHKSELNNLPLDQTNSLSEKHTWP